MKCIALFESLTGAVVKDCLLSGNGIAFVVKEGEMGRAIGRGGESISRVRRAFAGKSVFVFEDAGDERAFVENLFRPAKIKDLNIQEKDNARVAVVSVDSADRGSVIGREGERIKMARLLLLRHFNLELKLLAR